MQIAIATQAANMPTWAFLLLAYVVGGTVNHSLSLANHELSHNLAFHTPIFNELLSIVRYVWFCDPLPVVSHGFAFVAISLMGYHLGSRSNDTIWSTIIIRAPMVSTLTSRPSWKGASSTRPSAS